MIPTATKAGTRVTIAPAAADDTKPPGWLGCKGVIVKRVVAGLVGESPQDPFFIVRAKIRGKQREDGFWREELEWRP